MKVPRIIQDGVRGDSAGRKCFCNSLTAHPGLGRIRDGGGELPLVIRGADLSGIAAIPRPGRRSYPAAEVVGHLLTGPAMACI